MFEVVFTGTFKKDYKRCIKHRLGISALDELIKQLEKTGTVPRTNKPHLLSGNLSGYWECHVKPDWLLIWLKDETNKVITLVGTGTHFDLFR
ncbi:type II toxin-antitoxin system YafQ family toxin [Mangrovibacterium marinum]|uniref:mRNA interferase YafQ n=1 Tax=Mangrovibacterium marinum TaxID=1639118 RepID=A0A2T5C218_9BACT|nr:type II toxin-antitoxin system YafQ family toxin [Mangrovibacterium marinum]PTN08738.1 mRNA interferase YafQ [Mangrovibacterium marinum]